MMLVGRLSGRARASGLVVTIGTYDRVLPALHLLETGGLEHDAGDRFSRFVESQLGVSQVCPEVGDSDVPERTSPHLKAA
jgi:hypothetical protein